MIYFVKNNLDFILKITVLAVIGLIIIGGVWSGIGLYADAAHWLCSILETKSFLVWDPARLYGMFIMTLPAVLAIKLGLRDLPLLIDIYSLGALGIPLGLWIWALLIHRRSDYFWFFVIGLSVTYLNTGFYTLGIHNVLYSMVALSAAILFKNLDSVIGIADSITLLVLAFLMTRSYAAMVFLGPLLSVIVIMRFRLTKVSHLHFPKAVKTILCFCVVLYLIATLFSIYVIRYPQFPEQLADAARVSNRIVRIPILFTFEMLIVSLVFKRVHNKTLAIFLVALGLLTSTAYLLFTKYWPNHFEYGAFRALCGLNLFLWLAIMASDLLFQQVKPPQNIQKNNLFAFVSFVFFIALSIPFLSHLGKLRDWNQAFEKEVNQQSGLLVWEELPLSLNEPGKSYSSNWNNPSISLLVRNNLNSGIILSPKGTRWEPFNPHSNIPKFDVTFYKSRALFYSAHKKSKE